MSLLGQVLAGRYRLDQVIGAGGMATVYRARDERLDRDVAVKVLAANLAADPVVGERFAQEARALAAFTHPSLVAVYDVGDEADDPFFVMELIDGPTLADRLDSGSLPVEEAVPLLASVGEGLGALHAQGFVHRDVKPHNILLGAGTAPRLADFGLVRGDGAGDLTAPGTAIGTMAYLAPEVLAGEQATPSADVYALGVVAYQTLTGRLPFPTASLPALVAAQKAPLVPPSAAAPWLGKAFDEVIGRALGPAADRPGVDGMVRGLHDGLDDWRAWRVGTAAPEVAHATRTITLPPLASAGRLGAVPGRRLWLGWLIGLIGAVLAVALLIAFLGSIRPFESGAASPSGSATTQPSGAATEAPPVAATQVAVGDPIGAAIQAFESAVAEAQGGPGGLRGKEVRQLTERLDALRNALADRPDQATARADELVESTEQVVEERGADPELVGLARQIRDAVAARFGEGDD
jgi:Protein kinase domain